MNVRYTGWLCLVVSLFVAHLATAQSGGEFEITASSIDAGGGTSTGGAFEVNTALGGFQSVTLAGGAFELVGGVVLEVPPGDCDEDGDVDLADFLVSQECFTGPVGGTIDNECQCSDLDADGTIDLADVVAFQAAFTGSR